MSFRFEGTWKTPVTLSTTMINFKNKVRTCANEMLFMQPRACCEKGTERSITAPVLELEATQSQHPYARIISVESLTLACLTDGLCLPMAYA